MKVDFGVKKLAPTKFVAYRIYDQLTYEYGVSEAEAVENLEKSIGRKGHVVIDKFPDAFAHHTFYLY